ncbi:MAG: hypothetical protein KTU85_05490 [Acidimicrobiia bacterium]|nr:hypothetical protein [Acidimicrobiia bacterium]MCY4457651.1 hypothetical protein [Acidimicrobiaceae bacterium]
MLSPVDIKKPAYAEEQTPSYLPRVDDAVRGRLAALAVVTATGGYAYQRPDGVSVIPVTTLGP